MSIDKISHQPRHILSRLLIRYLTRPSRTYHAYSVTSSATLRRLLRCGDVLLVEGNQRFSTAVKYLTQSTWSHAALFVGSIDDKIADNSEPADLIEANLEHGVVSVPITKYDGFNTRICRPAGLTEVDCENVVRFMRERIGYQYDLKNVTDLARYLFPTPPVPLHWRRRMLALGSGDPTRVICSTLIAQAFQSVLYPILPDIEQFPHEHHEMAQSSIRETLHIRHHSLYAPRDFDVSPYFSIVKPTIEQGFDYKRMEWAGEGLDQ